MYLHYSFGGIPRFIPKFDEPSLMTQWVNHFPRIGMSVEYKLSLSIGDEWWRHFCEKIYNPISDALPVHENSISATQRKFNDWMLSSEDQSLFKRVKIQKFADEWGSRSAETLVTDVYCINCNNAEPFFLFKGTDDSPLQYHANYAYLKKAFQHSLFDSPPEISGCHICQPGRWYITPFLRTMARRKVGTCECMPCRGRL